MLLILPTLFILTKLLHRAAPAYAFLSAPPVGTRAVSSTSKAGLAWPNGPYVDINQYTTTGKVQWCVRDSYYLAR